MKYWLLLCWFLYSYPGIAQVQQYHRKPWRHSRITEQPGCGEFDCDAYYLSISTKEIFNVTVAWHSVNKHPLWSSFRLSVLLPDIQPYVHLPGDGLDSSVGFVRLFCIITGQPHVHLLGNGLGSSVGWTLWIVTNIQFIEYRNAKLRRVWRNKNIVASKGWVWFKVEPRLLCNSMGN